jgi:hypothetical protein
LASKVPGARGLRILGPLLLAAAAVACGRALDGSLVETSFTSSGETQVIARLAAGCDECDWQETGSETVVLAVTLDDRPPVHVPIFRDRGVEYRILLGTAGSGIHTLRIREESALTASNLRGRSSARWDARIEQITPADENYRALSLAPIIYARDNTVERFTDVPLVMWYEVEPTNRGTRYRYSVVFSNEDGGTSTDRLMATWGRTTDIEYLYSVEVDANGTILGEDMQGPEHEILPFKGKREGTHPLLWVSTENNMVLDHGTTSVRYAPAPSLVNLDKVSREVVMDANPWTYEVMAKELSREGKIVPDAPAGKGVIPDLRRFVFLEACGEAGNNAIAASVQAGGEWHASDRGIPEYRIVRDGCFRAAIPLPGATGAHDVSVVRFQAHPRKDRASGISRITRLNRVFFLDERFAPGPSILQWEGAASLTPGGLPLEIPVR